MNYNIRIEGLGPIDKADITINPLTILAGENGTGKSFVTKFLYSVLSTINKNFYAIEILNIISDVNFVLGKIEEKLSEKLDISRDEVKVIVNLIGELRKKVENIKDYLDFDSILLDFNQSIKDKEKDIEDIKELSKEIPPKINEYCKKLQHNDDRILSFFSFDIPYIKALAHDADKALKHLLEILQNPEVQYLKVLRNRITNELKENFQITEIYSLINHKKNECIFEVENLIKISIDKEEGLSVQILSDYLSNFEKIKHLIFFESPVYWRLFPEPDSFRIKRKRFIGLRNSEVLTGVPKHFYDLKTLLFTPFKEGERPNFIRDCAQKLADHLKGSFEASQEDLTFKNQNGESIPKNLVSFGMTNLGIIQSTLSKNLINIGSFVFIDEPESNLHPEWQKVLSEVLLDLAVNQVNVIITTHSTDILKAIEFFLEEGGHKNIDNLISINYFDVDGKLLEFKESQFRKIGSARLELLKPYNSVSIEKSIFND